MSLDRRISLPRTGKKRIVHESDLRQFDCPGCNGDGHAILADLEPHRVHSERAWQCKVCGGTGFIFCTSRTYTDLAARFKEGAKAFSFVKTTKPS